MIAIEFVLCGARVVLSRRRPSRSRRPLRLPLEHRPFAGRYMLYLEIIFQHVQRILSRTTRDAIPLFASASKMAPKRPSLQENSGRQNKKRKIIAAHTISVQEVGGPSRLSKPNDSNGQ
jgi:hypothetical protein